MSKNDLEFCTRHHNKSGRFIEACLLVLLMEEASYGYNLMERLYEFNFQEDAINMSIIYRNLKSLETRDLVKASWVEGDQGPNKKIYELTPDGRSEAEKWIQLLKFRRSQLQLIIDKYENIEKRGV